MFTQENIDIYIQFEPFCQWNSLKYVDQPWLGRHDYDRCQPHPHCPYLAAWRKKCCDDTFTFFTFCLYVCIAYNVYCVVVLFFSSKKRISFLTSAMLARFPLTWVICAKFYILGTKFYILGTKFYFLGTKFYFLGTKFYFLGTKFYILGTKFYFLGTKFYILGTKFYILGTNCHILGTKFYILGTNFYIRFSYLLSHISSPHQPTFRHYQKFWILSYP